MAKSPSSAIGIDLGEHTHKAVILQRKGQQKYVLQDFAIQEAAQPLESTDAVADAIKTLSQALSGGSKVASVALSSRGTILRIIYQPRTPVELLRKAVALNSESLLNQNCRDYVLDCDELDVEAAPEESDAEGEKEVRKSAANQPVRYLVGGILREKVETVNEGGAKARMQLVNLQLAPVCNLNAFAFSNPEAFNSPSFMLVDVGHEESTVLMGVAGDLKLVRTIDYGGKAFIEAVTGEGAIDVSAATLLLQQGDTGMAEASRMTISSLAREIHSSIAFFEGQHEATIQDIFLSGAICRAELPLQMLSDELDLPCQLWDPFSKVEVKVDAGKKEALGTSYVQLGAAFGAALQAVEE